MKNIAVVILSYNSLEETTKPCIESIYRVKTNMNFCVVVVDNLSTDGTRQYLEDIKNKYQNLNVILNQVNSGFAGGNNLGIKSVDADYYILLNSDTIVTDYWIDKMVDFLDKNPNVGMAGPVSNSVGNEQMIFIDEVKEERIIRKGLEWTEICHGDYFYTDMLGFFCVMIRKEVIFKVGLLDESYGIGMFEDDDYCFRVTESGYKLVCLEDVFIYHKGSISFKKLNLKSNEIFFKNLNLFETKFKITWKSHLNNKGYIDLLNNYLDNLKINKEDNSIIKIRNKLNVIKNFDYGNKSVEAVDIYMRFLEKEEELKAKEELLQTKVNELEKKELEKESLESKLMEISDWAYGMKIRLERIDSLLVIRCLRKIKNIKNKLSKRLLNK